MINSLNNIMNWRFAACMAGAWLLSIYLRTARRAPVSKSVSHFLLSAGGNFPQPGTKTVSQNTINDLTRCEIFRGKVPPRITQNQ